MSDISSIRNLSAGLVSFALSATCLLAPRIALAVEPSAGSQTGSGSTSITVQLKSGGETGGNTDPGNPDGPDEDDWGDNVAFSVPSAINFVASADGTLTGPDASSTYIENISAFGIHVSSFDVDPQAGWTIIADGTTASEANSADFQFGVRSEGNAEGSDMLDAYDYLSKKAVNRPALWNMAGGAAGTEAARVNLTTGGNLHKINADISTKTQIATIKTYITPSVATV